MILGIDYGKRKVGTALLHPDTSIPYPFELIRYERKRDLVLRLLAIIKEERVTTIVFGIPLHKDGNESDLSREIRRFGEIMEKESGIAPNFVNEFGTSKGADEILMGKKRATKKESRDLVAAVLILEAYHARKRNAHS